MPSFCTATASTVLSAPASPFRNVLSSVPSAFNRATRPRVTAPTLVNVPPITTLPTLAVRKLLVFRSTATPLSSVPAGSRAAGTKPVSKVPSKLNRASRPRATPFTFVNWPAITSCPPPLNATALIAASAPLPWLNPRSRAPPFNRTRLS